MTATMLGTHVEGCATPEFAHDGICRDKRNRPRIVLPERKPRGGLIVRSYTRTSGFGKVLDDLNGLMGWKCRMTALGLLERPDLLARVQEFKDDPLLVNSFKFKQLVEEALEAGGASVKSKRGTQVHKLTEYIDQGLSVVGAPPDQLRDLDAYLLETMLHGINDVMIEAFCVCDEVKAAGTFDRLVEYKGKRYIADLKTSGSVNFPHSWAIQMAVYSRSSLYDPETYERTPLDVDQDKAVLIHLPAGQARCDLYFIDIAEGWRAATELVPAVQSWRNNKGLLVPLGN